MSKAQEFDFTSMVDQQTIVQYLETLTKGFRQGQLTLASNGEKIILDPKGLIKLELTAKAKSKGSRLHLKLSWKESGKVAISCDEDED